MIKDRTSITSYIIAVFLLFQMCFISSSVFSQEESIYERGKNEVEFGITGGLFIVLFTDIEGSFSVNRRINNHIVVEGKSFLGRIRQLYLFEGNQDPYKVIYGGGSLGLNFGRQNKFLELAFGAAYYHNPDNAWGDDSPDILPVVNVGFKKKGEPTGFRFGLGWPYGLYLGIVF